MIFKYNYELQINETSPSKRNKKNPDSSPTRRAFNEKTVQLIKTKQTKAVNDIIESWTYTGDPMTKLLAFGDFIKVGVRDFESLVKLHDDYLVLYERYSRVLKDEPESREAVLVLLRNVERVQEAIGRIHEQTIDANDSEEVNEEELSECMRTISDKLERIKSNVPTVELRLLRSCREDVQSRNVIELSNCRSISWKKTIKGASFLNDSPLLSYVINSKQYLAFESFDTLGIKLWDVSNNCVSGTLDGHFCLRLSLTTYEKDGVLVLACGSKDGRIKLWDLSSHKSIQTLSGHDWGVTSLTTFTENNRMILISGGADDTIRMWDLHALKVIGTLLGHTDWIQSMCTYVIDETHYLASGSEDTTVKIWRLHDKSLVTTFEGHKKSVYSLLSIKHKDMMLLASGSDDGEVKIWDLNEQRCIQTWHAHKHAVRALETIHSRGKQYLVTASKDHTIKIWSLEDYELQTSKSCSYEVFSLTIVEMDGQACLASRHGDGKIRIWN